MDGTQENKLIDGIKKMVCARIDESRHEIIRDFERAEKEADRCIIFPISIGARFGIGKGKCAIKAKLSWGVKRSSEDACEFPIGKDLVDAMDEAK